MQLPHDLPIIARMDGKAFHAFTRGLERQFCRELRQLMVETTKRVLDDSNAILGYTQSDEVSLVWHPTGDTQMWSGGWRDKIVSSLASITTFWFNRLLPQYLPTHVDKMATFDARLWFVPTVDHVHEYLCDREADATRNSISMAAQSLYSHKELHGKSCSDMHEMLFQKGVNWNEYDDGSKRGVYVQKRSYTATALDLDLSDLPEKHALRVSPDMKVVRRKVFELQTPPIAKIANFPDLLYKVSNE